MCVAVMGAGHCESDVATLAEAVGRGLANRCATLVCGGLGGVMKAVCRGARSAGGLTVGILPGTSRRDANRDVDMPIVTGTGEAREVLVVRSAQAVIAIHSEYGTLSGIAHALKLGIPDVGLITWHLAKDRQERRAIVRALTPAETAVSLAAEK
jgi:uncharacterized protein (TIGR00725 family)